MPVIDMGDIETYYEDYGSGHPIVVLHGALDDHQGWAEQLQPLTDDYRVILYDLRGHGNTGGSDRDQYTLGTYADDLASFIDALDLTQPTVLGHSLGGMVGYVFADEYPEKLSSLITVGSSTPETFSTGEQLFFTAANWVIYPAMSSERLSNAIMWAQNKVFGEDATVDMDELEQLREAHDCDVPDVSPKERSKIMHVAQEYYGANWSWEIEDTPVLMLYGDNEPWIEPHAHYLETHLADCRSAAIPEASHNAHVDDPEFIIDSIREFLSEDVVAGQSV